MATDIKQASHVAVLLPSEAGGWKPAEADRAYDAGNLFELINGGAEVYRELNLKVALSRTYAKKGAADIVVDVFDMGSSHDAYGAYHNDMREAENPGIGQEAEYQGGALSFWKGRFFASIVALHENNHTKQAVLDIGRVIDGRISDAGEKPEIEAILPSTGLQRHQLFYFHSQNSLQRRLYLTDDNMLLLDKTSQGLLVPYQFENDSQKRPPLLVVLQYTTQEKAKQAWQQFRERYLTNLDKDGVAKKQSGYVAAKTRTVYIACVLEAETGDQAQALLKSVALQKGKAK